MGEGERRPHDADALAADREVTPKVIRRRLPGLAGAEYTHRDRHLMVYHVRKAEGNIPMALVTLTLEIRTDFNDADKQVALLEMVKNAAREITTTAVLLQERQVPEINLYENTMEGSRIVGLVEEGA